VRRGNRQRLRESYVDARSPVLLWTVAVLAIVMVAGACSSSSKHTSANSTSTSPSTGASGSPQASGSPIKVGFICSCSGAFGTALVVAEDVYKSWVNTINVSGGINGHPVQIVTEDDGGVPGTSISDVQTLLSDHVVAIADWSAVDQTWASTVQSAKIPVVGAEITEVPFYSNPDFYSPGTTEDAIPAAVALTAKEAGATKLGYVYCAEEVICAETGSLISSAASKYGEPLVYKAAISETAPNYTAQCLAAQQAGVNALNNGDIDSVFERVATDCARQGYHPVYLSSGNSFESSMLSAPGIKDSSWYNSGNLPYWDNVPAVEAMNAAVNKYYPGLVDKPVVWAGESTVSTWAAGLLLADAVKAGGLTASDTPTAAEITQGLEALKGDTLDGLAPPLTFPAGQPHPIHCWFTFRIQNGVPSMGNGGNVTCESGTTS
jgi:branched-chain amino acid transport system substrate-binding protein